MALSLGTLVGYLELDDQKFNRKADQADRKMTALQLHLKALEKVNPKIQIDVETKRLDELKAKMADLKAQAANGVDVKVDTIAALVEIDRVQARLRELHNKEIRVEVDTDQGNRRLDAFAARLTSVGKGFNSLWAAGLALAPALVPISAAAAGGLLGIGSASLAAAAGVGVLATALSGVSKAASALSTYREAVAQAGPTAKIQREQLSASVMSARAAYAKHPTAANARRLQIAQQKQAQGPAVLASAKATLNKSAYADQTPAGQRFAAFLLDKMAPATHGLKATAQTAVLPGLQKGLAALLPLMPTFRRLIDGVGTSIGAMAAKAGRALNDPFWRHFFTWLAQTAGPSVAVMGHTLGMFFEGTARALVRFAPVGQAIVMWIDQLATKFNAWTAGGGFSKFLAYVEQSGPAVLGVLHSLGAVLGPLVSGMAGTGLSELHVITVLLDTLASFPTPVLQAIGALLPVIVIGIKGLSFANGAASAIQGLSSAIPTLLNGLKSLSLAQRGLVGLGVGAGVAGFAATAHTKGQMGLTAGAVSGAVAGGSIGAFAGPEGIAIGAGVGAIAGALGHLAFQLKETGTQANKAGPALSSYLGTLNVGAKAVGHLTRALVVQNAFSSHAIDAGRKLGLSSKTIVDAIMGVPKAQAAVHAAMAKADALANSSLTITYDKYGNIKTASDKMTAAQYAAANAAAVLGRTVADNRNALKADIVSTNEAAIAAGQYAKALPGIPHRVATRIDQIGLVAADEGIVRLTRRYHLTPAMVRTILQAAGERPTAAAIQRIIDKARDLGRQHPVVKMGADTSQAMTQLRELQRFIKGLVSGKTHLLQFGAIGSHQVGPVGGLGLPARAAGGPIQAGLAYRVGERGPETIVATRSAHVVDAYNTRRMAQGSAGGIDYERLAQTMMLARPLYGDVHVTDGYGGFKRMMEQDRQLASLDGIRR